MTNRGVESSPAPRALWQRLYDADVDAVPSQSPQWAAAIRRTGSFRDAARLYTFASGRRLVMPMVERRVLGVVIARQAWPAEWNYGGVLVEGGGAPTREEVAAVLADVTASAAMARFVPEPRSGAIWAQAAPKAAHAVPFRTHALDVSGGFAATWSDKFSRTTRQHVRVAQKRGVEVTASRSAESLEIFAALYAQAVLRWGDQRGQPAWLSSLLSRLHDRAGQVGAVVAECGEEVLIWVATWRGEPVAVHVVLSHGENVHDWLGAVNHDLARESHGTYLLESTIVESACEQGRQWINLGESDPGGPVEEHKRRLGATAIDYSALLLERVPVTASVLRARSAAQSVLATRATVQRRLRSRAER